MSEQDTREKLEADVHQYANPSGCKNTLGACWEKKMLSFLDRQAAITRKECDRPNWDYCETCEVLAGLTAERDELLEKLEDAEHTIGGMEDINAELTAERDELQAAIDAMGNGQFYAMYRKVCEERDALRERLEAITAALHDKPGT